MNGRKVTAVIFDWDGTVADSREAMLYSYRYTFRTNLGIEFPTTDDEFRTIVKMRTSEMAAKYGDGKADQVAADYNVYYNSEGYREGKVFPGMPFTLEQLRARGYRLGVATNKALERLLTDMDHLGLRAHFDALVTSEDSPERKPHPAPLLKAAEKLGIDPDICAYVGDFSGDIIAAKAAGMVSVGVAWGRIYPEEDLRAQNPDYLLHSPEELLQIFAGVTPIARS